MEVWVVFSLVDRNLKKNSLVEVGSVVIKDCVGSDSLTASMNGAKGIEGSREICWDLWNIKFCYMDAQVIAAVSQDHEITFLGILRHVTDLYSAFEICVVRISELMQALLRFSRKLNLIVVS
jgi:hypothetical protein